MIQMMSFVAWTRSIAVLGPFQDLVVGRRTEAISLRRSFVPEVLVVFHLDRR